LSGGAALAGRLAPLCPGVALRVAHDGDRAFLADLYASTREAELAHVPWEPAAKRAFLHDQFALQHDHYVKNYVGAEFLVIENHGQPIGRIYLYRKNQEIRLMDIALVPEKRGQGIGGELVQALLTVADEDACEVTLHVEPNNPAIKLYDRHNFHLIENRGVYLFLGRKPNGQPQS
jgi:ribosomal protein S18 acetylase RimI-like enzyme